MFKKIMAALSAFILAGCLYADAEDLVIDGLGKLSFGEDVQITDGGGSRTETIFKKSGHRKDYGKTDWAAVMYFLTTPPGMDMYPDRAPYLTTPFICTRSGNLISAAPTPLPSLL